MSEVSIDRQHQASSAKLIVDGDIIYAMCTWDIGYNTELYTPINSDIPTVIWKGYFARGTVTKVVGLNDSDILDLIKNKTRFDIVLDLKGDGSLLVTVSNAVFTNFRGTISIDDDGALKLIAPFIGEAWS